MYEPFGKNSTTGASNTSSYQYTGRENDGTDLYYYRARYYHPHLQRFTSEDPIEFRGGDANLYAYVRNGPLNARDPFGLWTFQTGLNVSLTGFGGTFSGFVGIVIDDHGNVGAYGGGGEGVGVGFGGFLGVGGSLSNASNICGIAGPFQNLSAGGGSGAGATAEIYTGQGLGPNGFVSGAGGTIGLAGGASSSAQATFTNVHALVGRKTTCN
jgi:RHS repeat-associated protein